MEEIEVGDYVSRKEYLKKYNSNVGYALHVQNNIKKDDYARLNTGEIVKVIGIRENTVNKKAIYYGIYDADWFDSSAVENFSPNIIDLIEVGDYVNGKKIEYILETSIKVKDVAEKILCFETDFPIEKGLRCYHNCDIKTIVTREQFASMEYKIQN